MTETAELWKDKKNGALYNRETAERNIRDVVEDEALAEMIIREVFEPVHRHEAEATRMKKRFRERVKALKLNNEDSALVQLIGELRVRKEALEAREKRSKMEEAELADIRKGLAVMEERMTETQKRRIDKAIEEFRAIYDELITMINMAEVRNGYAPTPYRKGYFPHFQREEKVGLIAMFNAESLPTSIAGLTHNFRPGRRWVANLKERTGNKTTYDAVQGFDMYIDRIADYVWHMDDIQRLRAFEESLRLKFSDPGKRAKLEQINNDTSISEEERQSQKDALLKMDRSQLSHFVTWLNEYTNMLAGKKSITDRAMEYNLGRGMYTIMNKANARLGANMVAANISSAITNIIPITQALTVIRNPQDILRGAWETAKAATNRWNDGIADASDFMTNRRGSEKLVQSKTEKSAKIATIAFEGLDRFATGTIVRAAYYQKMRELGGGDLRSANGQEALRYADRLAADVMGDRSKGATPVLFQKSSPLVKALTAFQLEINNQLSFMTKDLVRYARMAGGEPREWIARLLIGLLEMSIAALGYNWLAEKLTGRKPAFSPIDLALEAHGYFTDDEDNALGASLKTLQSLIGELPFVSGGVGMIVDNVTEGIYGGSFGSGLTGGRLPLESIMPEFSKMARVIAADDLDWIQKTGAATWAVASPLLYIALPFGGGQVKKTIEGTVANIRGGSYSYGAKGERLRYPVDANAWTYLKGAVFGQYALPAAGEYVESGYRTLPTLETTMYRYLQDRGIDENTAYRVVSELKAIEGTKDKYGNTVEGESRNDLRRKYLLESDELTAKEKKWLDETYISLGRTAPRDYSSPEAFARSALSDSSLRRYERVSEAVDGIGVEEYTEMVKALSNVKSDLSPNGKVRKSAKEKKNEILREQFGCTWRQAEKILDAWEETYTGKERYALQTLNDTEYGIYSDVRSIMDAETYVKACEALRGIDERDGDGWLTDDAKAEIMDVLRGRFGLTEVQAEKFWYAWNKRAKDVTVG